MENLQIDSLNKEISYPEGKIFWSANKGYTSATMQYLLSNGWQATKAGAMHYLYDDKGRKVTSAYSWLGLLVNAAIVMR